MSGFPVVGNDGRVVGVVSETDLLAKQALDGEDDGLRRLTTSLVHRKALAKAGGVTAADLMTARR